MKGANFRSMFGPNKDVKPEMVWVDLETTGLPENVAGESILELGIMVTDRYGVERASYQSLVYMPGFEYHMHRANQIVRDMHEGSGLYDEVRHIGITMLRNNENPYAPESIHSVSSVTDHAVDWLREVVGPEAETGKLPMCGSTINFDRAFLAHHMRGLHDWFHYRNIDVSSIMNLIKMHRPDLYNLGEIVMQGTEKKHRVLDDLRESIAWYRFYLQNFLKIYK